MNPADLPIDWQSNDGLVIRRELTAIRVSLLMMNYAPAGDWEEITAQLRAWWEAGGIDQRDGLLSAEYCAYWLGLWVGRQTDMLVAEAVERLRQGFTQEQVTQLIRLWGEYRR